MHLSYKIDKTEQKTLIDGQYTSNNFRVCQGSDVVTFPIQPDIHYFHKMSHSKIHFFLVQNGLTLGDTVLLVRVSSDLQYGGAGLDRNFFITFNCMLGN